MLVCSQVLSLKPSFPPLAISRPSPALKESWIHTGPLSSGRKGRTHFPCLSLSTGQFIRTIVRIVANSQLLHLFGEAIGDIGRHAQDSQSGRSAVLLA